jgi:glutathione S-transferase
VYGVPLSPPCRAVIWTLLQKHHPFQVQLIVPGVSTKIGSLNDTFLAKTRGRTGIVPVIEDSTSLKFGLSESPAILVHLCENRPTFADLYGAPGTQRKAYIDEYMHWHHGNTKRISSLTIPFIRPDLSVNTGSAAETEEKVGAVFRSLDEGWLKDDEFIAATEKHSIADMLAYEEVAQASMSGAVDLSVYPNLKAWTQRMETIPFHEEAHAALKALGSLTSPSPTEASTPMPQRLGAATKLGLQAIKKAQEGFVSN